MSININLTITLDASDLLELRANLAAWRSRLALLAANTDGINKPPESHPSHPDPISPTAQNAPRASAKPARPAKIPARERTPVLPPIPAATMNGERKGDAENAESARRGAERTPQVSSVDLRESSVDSVTLPNPSNRLPFAEFDRMVRAEMKRLAMDGRLPGHKLWDSERSSGLPTMGAVVLRYRADGLVGLAEILGLEPPLSVQKKVSEA